MKNKMRKIKAAIGVRCVSCFVGSPATFLALPATLNLFDNPVYHSTKKCIYKINIGLQCCVGKTVWLVEVCALGVLF